MSGYFIHNKKHMLYKITGGIFFLLTAANSFKWTTVSPVVLGIFALLAGIGLLAGI